MTCTIRKVKLSDGTLASEFENKYIGGSETQVTYSYLSEFGIRIKKESYKLDYWGRIENIEIIN